MYEGIKLAVIGCGRWGINHVKTAYSLLGAEYVAVCDTDEKSAEKIKSISPEIGFTTDLKLLLDNPSVNAIIIATPAETHYEIAKNALKNGKHVLVEKPITLRSGEANELVEIARENGKKLMVGHVLLYHPAIIKIKEMLNEGKLGKLQYIYSNRLNLGSIRSEENILWSFAPHDISIIQFITGTSPVEIFAKGAAFVQDKIEDTTLTILQYPDNVHAHIFVSWLHPFKEHRLVVIGDKGMLVFEDSLKTEKLKFYKKGFQKVEGRLEKFDEDYEAVELPEKQPLTEEHRHFYEAVINNTAPLTDGRHAVEVLEILEKAQKNL
jgi:UDP-2-acetamido-3-amino-2,3-dideoxy-glucuronate N-acetyltransferase